ncbi:ABC transporter substrate-binding protein [Halomarina pelagica]|uniref:ABC transporter substrate-binding protein n=1 Tax=Halomarina pelagica TaxID=2961599 RepID=UPI0020C570F0|nr:ABC transporter substrate-binding protein [Halomarina sp. BND7]
MNRSRRAFLSTAGLALGAGCVGELTADRSGKRTSSGGKRTETTDISLLLNWKPNGLHAPYYAAKGEGFYEDQGLALADVESGQGSDFAAKQAGLGNTNFAITSADQVLNVNSRELSPLSVGVVMQRSPVVLFTARENFGARFTAVEQLEGKTLGTGPGMVRLLSKLMLERKGVLRSVELVDTGYDTVQRLLSGRIDAAGGVFGDVVAARHQGYTIDSVPVASVIPSYGHVIATSKRFARDRSEMVRAFVRATARGATWAHRHPEAAIDHLVDAVPVLAESREQQLDKWKLMSSAFMLSDTVRTKGWGWSAPKPWRTTYEALHGADLLGGSVDPSSVWTNDYIDTDYEYIVSYAETVSES